MSEETRSISIQLQLKPDPNAGQAAAQMGQQVAAGTREAYGPPTPAGTGNVYGPAAPGRFYDPRERYMERQSLLGELQSMQGEDARRRRVALWRSESPELLQPPPFATNAFPASGPALEDAREKWEQAVAESMGGGGGSRVYGPPRPRLIDLKHDSAARGRERRAAEREEQAQRERDKAAFLNEVNDRAAAQLKAKEDARKAVQEMEQDAKRMGRTAVVAFGQMTEGISKFAGGLAAVGLASKKDTEEIVRGLVKIHGAMAAVGGASQFLGSASKGYGALRGAVTTATALGGGGMAGFAKGVGGAIIGGAGSFLAGTAAVAGGLVVGEGITSVMSRDGRGTIGTALDWWRTRKRNEELGDSFDLQSSARDRRIQLGRRRDSLRDRFAFDQAAMSVDLAAENRQDLVLGQQRGIAQQAYERSLAGSGVGMGSGQNVDIYEQQAAAAERLYEIDQRRADLRTQIAVQAEREVSAMEKSREAAQKNLDRAQENRSEQVETTTAGVGFLRRGDQRRLKSIIDAQNAGGEISDKDLKFLQGMGLGDELYRKRGVEKAREAGISEEDIEALMPESKGIEAATERLQEIETRLAEQRDKAADAAESLKDASDQLKRSADALDKIEQKLGEARDQNANEEAVKAQNDGNPPVAGPVPEVSGLFEKDTVHYQLQMSSF